MSHMRTFMIILCRLISITFFEKGNSLLSCRSPVAMRYSNILSALSCQKTKKVLLYDQYIQSMHKIG